MIDYYVDVLRKYAVFSGRARRAEYWYFLLYNALISLGIGIIAATLGDMLGIVGILYGLAVLIPSLAVSVRRLHDIDKSGWWLLLSFIPLIGGLVLLLFFVQDGTPGPNKFGPDPKGGGTELPLQESPQYVPAPEQEDSFDGQK